MTNPCKNCPLNLEPYRKRKFGLKEKNKANDIILDGVVTSDGTYNTRYFQMYIFKKDMPEKIYFSGKAKLSFDGFLSEEDYKTISEEYLHKYEYTGRIELIGEDFDEKEWSYNIHGDFNEDLPLLLANSVRVRISPLESI